MSWQLCPVPPLLGLHNQSIDIDYFVISLSMYSKTCLKRPLSKIAKIGFQKQLWLNTAQKYCRILQGEQSAILLIFIKLPYVIKIFVSSIFEWPFKTGFTVFVQSHQSLQFAQPIYTQTKK